MARHGVSAAARSARWWKQSAHPGTVRAHAASGVSAAARSARWWKYPAMHHPPTHGFRVSAAARSGAMVEVAPQAQDTNDAQRFNGRTSAAGAMVEEYRFQGGRPRCSVFSGRAIGATVEVEEGGSE